jgi:hypothetical protein
MHITLIPNAQPQVIANLAGTCGKKGVIVQSLDSAGSIFVGTDQQALQQAADAAGIAQDGLLVQRQAAVTNIPSTLFLAPFSGTLYARNVGAANSILAVFIFDLE